VILEAKRKIAAAITIADANPIVIADENNDCEDTLMMLRTNKIQVSQQDKRFL
jgi:hypothetical protein